MLKFGIHDFLNASPLLLPLRKLGVDRGFKAVIDSPSALAESLKLGDLDLAMIPSVEYFKSADNYRLVPNICIASRGEVGSVLLLAKKPLNEIKSIAVDIRSRTSVAVLKILFSFRKDLEINPAPPNLEAMLADNSAALIIGDRALTLNQLDSGLIKYDLSEEWFRQTGKTFVHAVLAARSDVVLDDSQKDFIQKAKEDSSGVIKEAILAHGGLSEVDPNTLVDYLTNKIKYDLNDEAMKGLTHFRDLCYEHGIISKKTAIYFV